MCKEEKVKIAQIFHTAHSRVAGSRKRAKAQRGNHLTVTGMGYIICCILEGLPDLTITFGCVPKSHCPLSFLPINSSIRLFLYPSHCRNYPVALHSRLHLPEVPLHGSSFPVDNIMRGLHGDDQQVVARRGERNGHELSTVTDSIDNTVATLSEEQDGDLKAWLRVLGSFLIFINIWCA